MSDVFAVLTLRDGTRVSLPDDDLKTVLRFAKSMQ